MTWTCSYGVVNCPRCRRPGIKPKAQPVRNSYTTEVPARNRTWLFVQYVEKDAAKAAGAKWCPDKRQWYADNRKPIAGLAKWLPRDARKPVAAKIVAPPAPPPVEKPDAISFDQLMEAIAAADQADVKPMPKAKAADLSPVLKELAVETAKKAWL